MAAAFGELRLTVHLLHVAAGFDLGKYWPLAAELARLTVARPEHETLPAFRAATLCACGRRADALHVLASARARMTAHLGLGLTRELKDLRTTLLRDGPV
ncbi:BTAD domain-containing putative transcriptional regulator [Streptomyces althioticus]|uniref:Bacterial transcriptional activator domain-containing protein n=1 Tax=Actinospica acidiphila TaxID=304899 RepID=A0A9X5HE07_9ACTN|nr:BTAD domain-containing putative transcriptional regulator [Actinospica acidiphila]NEC51335.1 hypothetical protein [Actinospica acidiphila]